MFARFSSVKLPFNFPTSVLYSLEEKKKKLATHKPNWRNGETCYPSLGWGRPNSRWQALWDAGAMWPPGMKQSVCSRGDRPISPSNWVHVTPLTPPVWRIPSFQVLEAHHVASLFGPNLFTATFSLHPHPQPHDADKILTKGTSLVVWWLRVHLPMQGVWVQSLVRELGCHMLGSAAKRLKKHKSKK